MQRIKATHLRGLLLIILIGLVSFGTLALGQGTSGSLTGQVTDQLGAAVPKAAVTLTNVDTDLVLSGATDGQGVYIFKLLPAGKYSLAINAAGFAGYVQKGIVIDANLYATQNVQLKVAGAGATVNVTADAELIDTTTPELGMTVNQESVSELPLNGRDPSALALLSPGIVNGANSVGWQQSGFSFPNESVASSNGGRLGSTFYMLDGVTNMDTYLASNSPTPNPDAIGEFRLISSNFSAVYGTAVQVDNGIAYLDSGLALNAETGTEPGTFYSSGTTVATGPMVSDSNLGKLFILENASSSRTSARCLLETHDGLKHRLAHFVSIVAMPRFIQSPDRLLCGPPDSHMNAAGVL